MIIYYDLLEQKWFHTHNQQIFTFGIEKIPILFKKTPTPSAIPFPVTCRENGNLGPLVGILAGRNQKQSVTGNGPLFIKLQTEILDNGGISVVITPENMKENEGIGFLYLPFHEKWIKVKIPYPHIVYNRIPFRSIEQTQEYKEAIKTFKEKGIYLFNPFFLNKFELYTLFKDDPLLKKFVPETILVNGKMSLKHFLESLNSVYIKPTSAAKGRGIFKIIQKKNGTVFVQDFQKETIFDTFDDFWFCFEKIILKEEYLAQKEIIPLLYNGKRYDFRILAHFNGHEYIVTGVGIRQSEQQNLTTHIPHGGKIIPHEEVFRENDKQFFTKVVKHCGELLSEKLGFFGEFSIDAGISNEGDYVIYEVNSKPMSFDEVEIEKERIHNLVHLFKHFFEIL